MLRQKVQLPCRGGGGEAQFNLIISVLLAAASYAHIGNYETVPCFFLAEIAEEKIFKRGREGVMN